MSRVLDLTGDKPEVYDIEDCELCGAELSHCDCNDDENDDEEE
jgi:hypothetical protein